MFDINSSDSETLQIGDKVICIRASVIYGDDCDTLRVGKIYTIVDITPLRSLVLQGVIGAWLQNRFEKCSP